ncbi:hypothetical protein C7M84_013753 [Penaeus vannamei]|uniref:Uncharacterized protein n=1 Tax=Penaeus vannamei TaxID=6689 RepID=A0A423SVA3_PENVA|nr:hypothetical protein C7M84_013753 [Penaeus vannamei]
MSLVSVCPFFVSLSLCRRILCLSLSPFLCLLSLFRFFALSVPFVCPLFFHFLVSLSFSFFVSLSLSRLLLSSLFVSLLCSRFSFSHFLLSLSLISLSLSASLCLSFPLSLLSPFPLSLSSSPSRVFSILLPSFSHVLSFFLFIFHSLLSQYVVYAVCSPCLSEYLSGLSVLFFLPSSLSYSSLSLLPPFLLFSKNSSLPSFAFLLFLPFFSLSLIPSPRRVSSAFLCLASSFSYSLPIPSLSSASLLPPSLSLSSRPLPTTLSLSSLSLSPISLLTLPSSSLLSLPLPPLHSLISLPCPLPSSLFFSPAFLVCFCLSLFSLSLPSSLFLSSLPPLHFSLIPALPSLSLLLSSRLSSPPLPTLPLSLSLPFSLSPLSPLSFLPSIYLPPSFPPLSLSLSPHGQFLKTAFFVRQSWLEEWQLCKPVSPFSR